MTFLLDELKAKQEAMGIRKHENLNNNIQHHQKHNKNVHIPTSMGNKIAFYLETESNNINLDLNRLHYPHHFVNENYVKIDHCSEPTLYIADTPEAEPVFSVLTFLVKICR